MIYIAHRRNSIQELENTSREYGVEIDIRSFGEDLILHHEPFVEGEKFKNWIKNYNHRILILNVKEDGLEKKIMALMKEYSVKDFFFLDQAFPTLVQHLNKGNSRSAIRLSEYESPQMSYQFSGKANWVWADCFNRYTLNKEISDNLQGMGFKVCLVSPELQGRTGEEDIQKAYDFIETNNIVIDGICTKRIDLWERLID
jgi:hypothetical protein